MQELLQYGLIVRLPVRVGNFEPSMRATLVSFQAVGRPLCPQKGQGSSIAASVEGLITVLPALTTFESELNRSNKGHESGFPGFISPFEQREARWQVLNGEVMKDAEAVDRNI